MNPPEPMKIGPAIEALKILKHYVPHIKDQTDPMTLVRILLNKIQERQPSDGIRLASLMYGISLQEIMDKLPSSENRGSVFYKILVEGFIANPLPDLVNAGHMMGIIEEGWDDAWRTN